MVVTDFPDHKNTMKMTKRSSQITVQVVGQKIIMKSQFGKKKSCQIIGPVALVST